MSGCHIFPSDAQHIITLYITAQVQNDNLIRLTIHESEICMIMLLGIQSSIIDQQSASKNRGRGLNKQVNGQYKNATHCTELYITRAKASTLTHITKNQKNLSGYQDYTCQGIKPVDQVRKARRKMIEQRKDLGALQ